ncbi:flagellar assembly protein FliH [Anaerobacterium chartisolvens]|uniref:Flagellar assembly protein FliH n=1 Tax=Anaerobacterium chartisolvens TaxID=1297424 RepID=A0A369B1G4_9FIRM|nr:FliH/SctL family protein [Anaerobacterium chartisolvens]RCX15512.1 flagellar assembly protein FliH [Anaerobacterium chartisolvens]
MSSNIYKNYQINLGIPFTVKSAVNFHTINTVSKNEDIEDSREEIPEDIISSAKEEAELIIKEAHYEAERIIKDAEARANESSAAIEEEARQRGLSEGMEQARMQYEALINEAGDIKQSAKVEYNKVLEGMEADTVGVIIEIAQSVIGRELELDNENILYLVRQAFEKCINKEKLILRVSMDDYDYVSDNKNKLLSMTAGIGELEIKGDPSLKRGACMVDTPFGSVDAGADTKMRKIEECFRQALGRGYND